MPIYVYKCASCGYAKDVLQKLSDAPLTVCPQCGQAAFQKQVTAAGFQLKGTGWYVTDFRGGSSSADASADKEGKAQAKPEQAQGGEAKTEAKPEPKSESKSESASGSAPLAASAPSAPAAPASGGAASSD
jgi:putative FmdB family regulatory protein